MPTPGVAPARTLGTQTSGGVPWTRGVSRSRRASRTSPTSLPVAVHALDAGLAALDLDPHAGGAAGHRGSRPPAPRLDVVDQPDRDPRSRGGRHGPHRRQPHAVDVLRGARRSRGSSISGRGGGYPGLPLAAALPAERALLVEPIAQEGALPRDGHRGDRAGRHASRRRPIRSEALAADPRHRGRGRPSPPGPSRPLAELVELAFPLLAPGGILVAWKRATSAARSTAAQRAMHGPRRRRRSRASRSLAPGLDGHVLVVVTRRGRRAGRLPSRPGRQAPPTVVTAPAATPDRAMRIARRVSDVHSNLVALDAVLAHAGPVDAVWHLGDVVGYGPDPDGVVARLAEVGAVGVRGNHDAAAVGGDEIDSSTPRPAPRWTGRGRRSRTPTRAWLAALPERRAEAGLRPSSTAARATRPGSTSPRRPPRGRRSACSRRRTGSTATPTSRSPSR